MRKMTVIGITGSIGMGKTTASGMLQEMGIPVHDSDAAVHQLLATGGRAVNAVGKNFPEALKKNAGGESYIDRQILGRMVFADRHKKKELEEILHPLVRAESDKFIEDMRQKGEDIVALDIPLLFETGGEKRVDLTFCVTAPHEVQKERVLARHGMTSEKFDRIVAGQLPDAEKRRRSDYVIESDKGLDEMRHQLHRIIDRIRAVGG